MAWQEKQFDEWLDRAFRLAYFLHPDRETAKKIALSAMNKLETASTAQFKRFYYTPVGRTENLRAARSRVSLNDLQLLQRLVFVESEVFEKENEGNRSEKELLKFFIKHLVRIALKRNSFYMTLGVSRVLHNYATADAMEIYNIIVQDPERVHDDYYYRSRKGLLMKELKIRFGDLLTSVKASRGEERFLSKRCDNLSKAAQESLKTFMPWESACAIPEKFDPCADIIKPFYFDRKDPDEEHRVEVRRIHAALHPECFARLTDALDLPKPEEKLEIPKFMTAENYIPTDNDSIKPPPPLEADELQQMKDFLKAQTESRKAFSANLLRVFVDGEERAATDLSYTPKADFILGIEAELIELRAYENGEDLLLAAHLLNFGEIEKGARNYQFQLENGQKISFELKPVFDEYGEISLINCAFEFFEKEQILAEVSEKERFSFANYLPNLSWIFKPAFGFALILLLIGFGWFVIRKMNEENNYVHKPEETNQNDEIVVPKILPPEENEEPKNENDSSDLPDKPNRNPVNQNANNSLKEKQNPKPEQKPPPKKEVLVINPPRTLQAENKNRKKENQTDADGILRLPIRETRDFPKPNPIRPVITNKIIGKPLNEIKIIFIEISGDAVLGQKIAEEIAAEINISGRFSVTNDKETADAALKIYVRHEADVDAPEEKMATAIVRLVNEEGFVVYPNRKRVSGWKYVGEIGKLPRRIAGDLLKFKSEKVKK